MGGVPTRSNNVDVVSYKPNKKCMFFHRWVVVTDTGATRYMECKRCSARRIVQCIDGYQPIDFDFLKIEEKDPLWKLKS